MFRRLTENSALPRLCGLGGLFLLAPLLATLSLLLFVETGRNPITRRSHDGRFRFLTRQPHGRHGPFGLAVECSGLHLLPGLINLMASPHATMRAWSRFALAPASRQGYRRTI
jgi:hypothetical protein